MSEIAFELAQLAVRAGEIILDVRRCGVSPRRKADRSLVCEADERAEAFLTEGVSGLFPGLPIVAEEAVAKNGPPTLKPGPFILIDALDGTYTFVHGGDDFTVNAAVIDGNGAPTVGVVYAPAYEELCVAHDGAAWRMAVDQHGGVLGSAPVRLTTRAYPQNGLRAVRSRGFFNSATQAVLDAAGARDIFRQGSSLKFCTIAKGHADVYARFGPTHEWDVAAGHAVLRAAGGDMTTPMGELFRYGKPGFENGPFVAWGRDVRLGDRRKAL